MPNSRVKTDTIDGVVIRLLGMSPGQELDYETYFERIKKVLLRSNVANKAFSEDETQLLKSELKRAQNLKKSGARFKVREKKSRVSSAPRQSRPSQRLLRPKGEIVKAEPQDIVKKEDSRVKKVTVKDVTSKNPIETIKEPLDSIFDILKSKFKFGKKQTEAKRKEEESEKRGKRESTLEGFKKGISEIAATTKKMLAPFEDVINRIKRFLFFTLLGRAFTGFMEWMKDKGNQEKFNSFVEFLSKHWPAIAGLYILFGTSLGKLARGLVKLAVKMIIALAKNIPRLFSFIKKNKKLAVFALGAAALAGPRIAELFNAKEPEESKNIDSKDDFDNVQININQINESPAPKLNSFNLGGMIPKFAAGGINPFAGMDFFDGVPVKGARKDDTLIAAKTGEAILTEEDQDAIGSRFVDRETGEPLNIPQYLSGRKPGQVALNNLQFPTLGGGGFFNGGMISQFNQGGMVGTRRNSGSLGSVIRNAQQTLLNRQAEKNTSYYNPLSKLFGSPYWHQRHTLGREFPLDGYNMPGFSRGSWNELNKFRGTVPGPMGEKERHGGSLRYAPEYTQPGLYKPLALQTGGLVPTKPKNDSLRPQQLRASRPIPLQSGGLVENIGNWFRSIFNRGENPPSGSPPKSTAPPKPLEEYQTPEVQAFLRAIRIAEHYRGSNPYQAIYGGANIPALTKMTIKEAIDMGNSGKLPMRFGGGSAGYRSGSAATGAYQFMPFTLEDLVRRGAVKLNQIFTPQLQDKLGWELAKNRGVNLRSLKQSGLNQTIMDMIAPEWASFPHSPSGGKSYYGQPVKSADFLRQIYLESIQKDKKIKNQSGGIIKGKRDGGMVKESSTKIPGATRDRIPAALEPGEFVVTKKAVNVPGVLPALENLNRTFDSNSAAYLGKGSVKLPPITPPMSGGSFMPNIMELPPIMTSAGGATRPRASGLGGGSQVPSFSVVAPDNERAKNAAIYGLVA